MIHPPIARLGIDKVNNKRSGVGAQRDVVHVTDLLLVELGAGRSTAPTQIMPNPSIVDKLVRAAAAVSADIPDDELNRHVADILAKEAKEKESKWREMGIGAYLHDTVE